MKTAIIIFDRIKCSFFSNCICSNSYRRRAGDAWETICICSVTTINFCYWYKRWWTWSVSWSINSRALEICGIGSWCRYVSRVSNNTKFWIRIVSTIIFYKYGENIRILIPLSSFSSIWIVLKIKISSRGISFEVIRICSAFR